MKVVKESQVIHRTRCRTCGKLLEYDNSDTYITKKKTGGIIETIEHTFKPNEYFRCGRIVRHTCIRCPVCRTEISIDTNLADLFDDSTRYREKCDTPPL